VAGHSKWAQIKHKKAQVDAKRGKLFSKIVKEIAIAARLGGGDPSGNPRLRTAIDKAKEVNMPADNIKRAVMKGTGELPGVAYEDALYEGYGPAGVAVLVEVLTDNKNRTVPEIRHLLTKHGGNLGEAGCVSWMFQKKGYILVGKERVDEDTLMSAVLDAGAEDLKNDPKEDNYEIITAPEHMERVRDALKAGGITADVAEISMIPNSYIPIDAKQTEQMLKLIDALEEHDDVQNVYTNFDAPEDVISQVER